MDTRALFVSVFTPHLPDGPCAKFFLFLYFQSSGLGAPTEEDRAVVPGRRTWEEGRVGTGAGGRGKERNRTGTIRDGIKSVVEGTGTEEKEMDPSRMCGRGVGFHRVGGGRFRGRGVGGVATTIYKIVDRVSFLVYEHIRLRATNMYNGGTFWTCVSNLYCVCLCVERDHFRLGTSEEPRRE